MIENVPQFCLSSVKEHIISLKSPVTSFLSLGACKVYLYKRQRKHVLQNVYTGYVHGNSKHYVEKQRGFYVCVRVLKHNAHTHINKILITLGLENFIYS
jgi:hypothetical protein